MAVNIKMVEDATLIPVESLIPNDSNPKIHGKAKVKRVAMAIEAFGFNNPILIQSDRTIIAGHCRRLAAIDLGMKKVPCIILDHLDNDQALAYLLADNKTQEGSDFDIDIEAQNIMALHEAGIDLMAAGYNQTEVDKAILKIEQNSEGGDETPEPPEDKDATTKAGDLWVMGGHRLICGDSTDPDTLSRLMGGNKADLYSTDPPYGVSYKGGEGPVGKKDWSGEYTEIGADGDNYRKVVSEVMRIGLSHCKDNAALYWWYASPQHVSMINAFQDNGVLLHQEIFWVKPTVVPGYLMWYMREEPCLMGWVKGNKPHINGNVGELSNVWEYGWEDGKKLCRDGIHPTQKPIKLFELPMLKHTKRGAICLESFGGSGSQIIAAESLGRKCYAVELMPGFCDAIVQRWETFTGKKAELVDQ